MGMLSSRIAVSQLPLRARSLVDNYNLLLSNSACKYRLGVDTNMFLVRNVEYSDLQSQYRCFVVLAVLVFKHLPCPSSGTCCSKLMRSN